jgi:hypothetical protein
LMSLVPAWTILFWVIPWVSFLTILILLHFSVSLLCPLSYMFKHFNTFWILTSSSLKVLFLITRVIQKVKTVWL